MQGEAHGPLRLIPQATSGFCHPFTQTSVIQHRCIEGKNEGSSPRDAQEHLTMVFLPTTVSSEQESIPYRGVVVIIYKSRILQCFFDNTRA